MWQLCGRPLSDHGKSGNVTLGERGAYCHESPEVSYSVPGIPSQVVDTIGAGDAHIGAVLACLQKGKACTDSMRLPIVGSHRGEPGGHRILPRTRFLFREG